MDGYLYCGLSEQLATEEIARDPVAKWYVESGMARSSRDDIRGVVTQAHKAWAGVANIDAIEVPEGQADLVIRIASIDGPSGVLADCMLPGPAVQILRVDQSELWTVHLGPDVSGAMLDLYRVILHELGHFRGIGHDRKGARSLMAPTYARDIWTLQAWDIQEIQRLYGPPRPKKDQVSTYMAIFDQEGLEMRRYKLVDVS